MSETKTDDGFPILKFLVHDFSPPYRLDHDSEGGGIMLYIREDISSTLLTTDKEPMKSLYVEFNLRNERYLINCSNNSYNNNIKSLPQPFAKYL